MMQNEKTITFDKLPEKDGVGAEISIIRKTSTD